MAEAPCPTCGTRFDPDQSRARPFCSERCRQIDLGRWLNEEISLPYRDRDDSDESLGDDGDGGRF